jgi:hypothetical protein
MHGLILSTIPMRPDDPVHIAQVLFPRMTESHSCQASYESSTQNLENNFRKALTFPWICVLFFSSQLFCAAIASAI